MRSLTTFSSLYIATLLMLTGSGLLTTYLSLKLALQGASDTVVSSMTTAYYIGMVLGAKLGHHLIARVGHIRSYVAASGITAAIALMMGLIEWIPFWAVGRFIIGLVMMCQYMVLESWLNEQAEPHQRGLVFGLYMAATYGGMVIGQLTFMFYTDINHEILMIVAICFSLCLVPLAVTRTIHPTPLKSAPLAIGYFLRKLPQILTITLLGGMLSGTFYALAPLFANRLGMSTYYTGLFMAISIGAALFAQWPLAWLSDRFNRLKLISLLTILFIAAVILLFASYISAPTLLQPVLFFSIVATGLQFTIYPLTVAIANDNIEEEQRVSLSAILLVVFGLGSALGPMISAYFSEQFSDELGASSVYLFPLIGGVAIIALNLFKTTQRLATAPEEASPHVMMPEVTSPIAATLDPRIDEATALEVMAHEEAEEIKEALRDEFEEQRLEKNKTKIEKYALVPLDESMSARQFIHRFKDEERIIEEPLDPTDGLTWRNF